MSDEIPITENFRHDDPDTSETAFRSVEAKIKKNHLKFMAVLKDVGSSTASEMMEHVGMIYNSTWRRLSELKHAGMVINTDERRKNPRGLPEVVFVLSPEGEAYIRTHVSELQ